MKRSLPLCLLLCLGLLAGLTGCLSSHKQDTGLSIEVARLERAADGAITVQMILLNPSVVAFNIAGSTHKLFLDGRLAGRLTVTDPVGLAAQSQSAFSALLVPEKGVALPASGHAGYRIESELNLRLYGDSVEYTKLAAEGTVPVTAK
ncbi:MAG: hypothetical protein ACHQ4G_09140 [Opitutales bacterium]